MQESSRDPNNLAEHVAIPYGGWKLAGGIAIHLWLILCAWALSRYAATELERITTVSWAYLTGGGIFTIALMLMNLTLLFRQREWLARYWRRNVRGYVVIYRTKEDIPWCSTIAIRGDEVISRIISAHQFVILWPLGGWFHRPTVWWRARRSGWTVERTGKHFLNATVRVTDTNGNSLRFESLRDAMTIIARRLEYAKMHSTDDGAPDNPIPFTWESAFWDMQAELHDTRHEREDLKRRLSPFFNPPGQVPTDRPFVEFAAEQVRRRVAERDAARGEVDRHVQGFLPAAVADRDKARGERDEAREEYDKAVIFVGGIADELEATSRLSQSLESLRVLDRIHNWLCWAYQGKDRHADAQAKLALVREKLVEKQKADRRRHGRKAGTAAAGT